MKKILTVFLAILLVAGVAFGAVTIAVQPGYKTSPGVGDIQTAGAQDTAYKTFRMVRYVPRSANSHILSKDRIVVWCADALTGQDGLTVTTSLVSYDNTVAGVTVSNLLSRSADVITQYSGVSADVGKINWGWIQTGGIAQVDMGASVDVISVDPGDLLSCGGGAGNEGLAVGFIFPPTPYDPGLMGVIGPALEPAGSSSTDIAVYLKGLN